jgi:hypothetical protein
VFDLAVLVVLDQLIDESAYLAGIAGDFRLALLCRVELLQDRHRYEHVVFLEAEQ